MEYHIELIQNRSDRKPSICSGISSVIQKIPTIINLIEILEF
jgi:hypothetical protein